MGRIGLVLGAGGLVGQAYHAGVLSALAEGTGWDPRSADVIVGSSAGSVTGAVLRLGASADDLAAFLTDGALSPEGEALFGALRPHELDLPPLGVADLVRRRWRPPTVRLVGRALRRPWGFRPTVAAMTMLPPGQVDLLEHTTVLDAAGAEWPEGLLICAARRDDGHRVVFGRPGAPAATIGQAVAASCAIPGYFAPVEIGGVQYFDGGVHSPTNATALADAGLDLVIAVSPMSVAGGRAADATAPLRLAAHRRLQREMRRLRQGGTEVLAFEPDGRTLPVLGLNPMADDRSHEVIEAARTEVHRRLGRAGVQARLDLLRRPLSAADAA
jgi:NTE family protein